MIKKRKKKFYDYPMIQQLMPVDFFWWINPLKFVLDNISYKHFFATLCRRIWEDATYNNFYTTLTSFEIKTGFWLSSTSQKMSEQYYMYAILAHMNGFLQLSPIKIIWLIQMIFISRFSTTLSQYEGFIHSFVTTIQLWLYWFLYHLKEIPKSNQDSEMRRCINSFISLWTEVSHSSDITITQVMDEMIKGDLSYFFVLYYAAQRFQNQNPYWYWFSWLQEYCKQQKLVIESDIVKNILQDYYINVYNVQRKLEELVFLEKIYPKQSYIYGLLLFDPYHVWTLFFGTIVPSDILSSYLNDLMYGRKNFYSLMQWIWNPILCRERFLPATKKLGSIITQKKFNKKEQDEIFQFFSWLEQLDQDSSFEIPNSLRRDWELMDALLQFYLHHCMSGFQYNPDYNVFISDNSNFFEAFKQHIISFENNNSHDEEVMITTLLHQYTINKFYYDDAYKKIMHGSERFSIQLFPPKWLPLVENSVVDEISIHFLPTLLQDTLYIQPAQRASQIESWLFQKLLWTRINHILWLSCKEHIALWYWHIFNESLYNCLITTTNEDKIHMWLKQHLYQLDSWLRNDISTYIVTIQHQFLFLNKHLFYITHSILRQTILGVLLFYCFIDTKNLQDKKRKLLYDVVEEIIIREVWFLPFRFLPYISSQLKYILDTYRPLIQILVDEMETKQVCEMIYSSLKKLVDNKSWDDVIHIWHEDIIRFRESLKHLQYFSLKSYQPI